MIPPLFHKALFLASEKLLGSICMKLWQIDTNKKETFWYLFFCWWNMKQIYSLQLSAPTQLIIILQEKNDAALLWCPIRRTKLCIFIGLSSWLRTIQNSSSACQRIPCAAGKSGFNNRKRKESQRTKSCLISGNPL